MALRKLKFHLLDSSAMDQTCQNPAFSGDWPLREARKRIKVSELDPGQVLPPGIVKRNHMISRNLEQATVSTHKTHTHQHKVDNEVG